MLFESRSSSDLAFASRQDESIGKRIERECVSVRFVEMSMAVGCNDFHANQKLQSMSQKERKSRDRLPPRSNTSD